MTSNCRILLMLGSAVVFSYNANAQTVLYGNLNAAIGSYLPVAGSGPLYNSFSTGAAGLLLTDLKVYLHLGDSPSGTATVALFADSGGSPGTQLQVLGTVNDNIVTAAGAYDLPISPGIQLNPNTRYWIGISTANGSDIEWASTNTGTGNIANEFKCSFVFSGGGVTGATSDRSARPRGIATALTCTSAAVNPFVMQVTASSAAVPSVPALSFSGMTLLTLLLAASAATFMRRSHPNAT